MHVKFLASVFLLFLVSISAPAQKSASLNAGLGLKLLNNHRDWSIMVPAMEVEYFRPYNTLLSFSGVAGVGAGKRESLVSHDLDHYAFLSHLDGNIFLSPFGNTNKYNLRIGTGLSIMYASEWFRGTAYDESAAPLNRFRAGLSMIMENEWHIGNDNTLGLKTMVQPYTNQEWVASLMFKYGWRL